MKMYARQGDLVIDDTVRIAKDADMVKRKNFTLAGDSSGHRHVLEGEALFAASGNTNAHQVRITKKTKLTHAKPDGHKTVTLVPGDYEIRRLRERGDATDRVVED